MARYVKRLIDLVVVSRVLEYVVDEVEHRFD